MKQGFTNDFRDIILRCQELRKIHDLDYEEVCKEVIEEFSNEIIGNGLIDKQEGRHFAIQLCIVNGLKYKI